MEGFGGGGDLFVILNRRCSQCFSFSYVKRICECLLNSAITKHRKHESYKAAKRLSIQSNTDT